ncbi:MAG: hypothetical protein RLO01_01820 [Thalassobaculaceae bacterium]
MTLETLLAGGFALMAAQLAVQFGTYYRLGSLTERVKVLERKSEEVRDELAS